MDTRDESKALRAFRSVWSELFRTATHLDSALSKQSPELKSELARALQTMLRRPVSEAKAYGLKLPDGTPWSLSPSQLADWGEAGNIFRVMRDARFTPIRAPEVSERDFPPWLIEEWTRDWGAPIRDSLIQALGEDPPLSLRASRKSSLEPHLSLLNKLGALLPEGVTAKPSPIAPFGTRISGYAPVLNSSAYRDGDFEIQDEGSQVMALFALWPSLFGGILKAEPAADPQSLQLDITEVRRALSSQAPSWTVVDACAGAGGKTLALADALQGRGRVFAYDTSAGKIQALRKRASRAGLRNIQGMAVQENNEAELVKRFRRRADVVLVDAPCSGWGVLRRNPDIKWRPDTETLGRMPGLQRRILTVYSDLVAPGGSLVFGVCTFRKAETLDVVRWFAERNPDFKVEEGGYLGPGGTDGFYMQRFRRDGGSP